jgi:O-antigen/teichoic acid export membrane protein
VRRRTLVRGSVLVLASTFAWHASSFLFNAGAARLFGVSHYGRLAAVMALLAVASPSFVALQTVASRITTQLSAAGDLYRVRGLVRFYGLRLAFVGVVAACVVALFSTAVARFLRVGSGGPIAILGIVVLLSVLTHLQRGVLQGSAAYARLSASMVTEAITKIVATMVIVAFVWRSVGGALLGIAIAAVMALAANAVLLRFLPRSHKSVDVIAHPYRYSATTLATLALLALLFSADVLAAKRYLDPHDAGLYAAVALCGKIVFFATSAFSPVLFPWFSSRQERGVDSRRPLGASLAAVAAVCSTLVAIYFLVPSIVIVPLFGSEYRGAEHYIGWMGIALGAYSIAYLASMYLLSQKIEAGAAVLAVIVIGQLAALYSFHDSVRTLIEVQTAVLGVAAVALVVLAAYRAPATAPTHAAIATATPQGS